MRKYTSAAGLAIRLTWLPVLVWIGTLCAIQWAAFLFVDNAATQALEHRLDNWPMNTGRLAVMSMMVMLHNLLKGGKGSQYSITLKRLSLSEMRIAAVWTLVFAGWFLIYWAAQLATVLGMYAQYVAEYGGSRNLLFTAAMRSDYFHYLLPLYEPWGFIRNTVLCLAFGSFAALGSMNARNGRWNPLCLAFAMMIPWALFWPQEAASQWQDITVSVCAIVCVIWDWIWTGRWMRSEDA